jgi:hypothetical protein
MVIFEKVTRFDWQGTIATISGDITSNFRDNYQPERGY